LWVRTPADESVGAIPRTQVPHYRFRETTNGPDSLTTCLAHKTEIDQAVLRRIAAGSLEPILLREADFGRRPAGAAIVAAVSAGVAGTSGRLQRAPPWPSRSPPGDVIAQDR
jgi:hypothetical protein